MSKPKTQDQNDGFLPTTFVGWMSLFAIVAAFAALVYFWDKTPKPAPMPKEVPLITLTPTKSQFPVRRQRQATSVVEAVAVPATPTTATTEIIDENERKLNAMGLTQKGGSKVTIVRTNNNQ